MLVNEAASLCPVIPFLEGEWLGHYTHFEEVIQITRLNIEEVGAFKITGNDFVPAGECSWSAWVNIPFMPLLPEGPYLGKGQFFRGKGQVADPEFRNARWIDGYLQIVNQDTLVFFWHDLGFVEYRRD